MKRILLLSLVGCLLVGGVGCGVCGRPVGCPGAPGTMCEPACGPCGGGGPCATPSYDECGPPCGGCEPACGPPCGSCGPAYGPYGGHRGPIRCVLRLLGCAFCCDSGCGQTYWGGWHSDPPDCHDPCDQCGNYTGVPGGYMGGGCGGGCSGGCAHGGISAGYSSGCQTCARGATSIRTASPHQMAQSHKVVRR